MILEVAFERRVHLTARCRGGFCHLLAHLDLQSLGNLLRHALQHLRRRRRSVRPAAELGHRLRPVLLGGPLVHPALLAQRDLLTAHGREVGRHEQDFSNNR